MVDTNDALLGEGPFSPNRAGTVPVYGVIEKTAREGRQAARNFFGRASGFKGLLGTDDLRQVEARLDEPQVRLTTDAYALQVAKYMLGLAAGERPRAFFLTGAGARFGYVVDRVRERIAWAAPVHLHPGEFEMQALASGVGRVLQGREAPRKIDEVLHGSAGL
jgi:butyrate kinase